MSNRGTRWRVFVSHTSELDGYPVDRSFVDAAKTAIVRAGHVPVDMAEFPASPGPSAQLCAQTVAGCDVYLAVIGFRYGSPVRDQPEVSYTEFEFEQATAQGLPRLVFLLDEDAEVPARLTRDLQFGARQEAFRRRAMNGPTVRVFRNAGWLGTEVLHALTVLVEGGPSAPGPLFAVPPLEGPLVDRPELLDSLVAMLCTADAGGGPLGVTTAGVEGTGGFGKTTLAAQVCRRPEVLSRFPNGILWVTVGEQVDGADLVVRVNDLSAHISGRRPGFTQLEQAAQHLGRLLDSGRRLMVIDDVWRPEQLAPFLAGGQGCTRLVTTRVRSLLLDTPSVYVDAMSVHEARQLLTAGIHDAQRVDWSGLLARTGGWPVLLALVNRAMHRRLKYGADLPATVRRIESALAEGGPDVLDITNSRRRHDAVAATVGVSLALLAETSPGWDELYRKLAVFPEDSDIPLSAVASLWGIGSESVEEICVELGELSLVQQLRLDGPTPSLRLHDVIRAHLRHRAEAYLPATHNNLLDAYRGTLPSEGAQTVWWVLPNTHGYMWRNLAYHLFEAGRNAELADLLHDLRWTVNKIRAVGPVAIEADTALLPNDVFCQALGRLVRQTGHLHQPGDSLGMTFGTVSAYAAGFPALRGAVADLRRRSPTPFLAPIAPPLPDQPDPALRRTFAAHTDWVVSLAVGPDGRWLASASDDGTVRVWDMTAGAERAVLAGHEKWVESLAAGPAGDWLASASHDATVRIWDVTAGVERAVLRGHTGPIRALVTAPDGSWLASAGEDGTVRVWDMNTGAERVVFTGHTNWVVSLAVGPAGSWLASAGHDATVRVWDVMAGVERAVFRGHVGPVWALASGREKPWLASAGDDGEVRIWNVATGGEPEVLHGHSRPVRALAAGPGKSWLASAGDDGEVRIWDISASVLCRVLTTDGGRISALVAGPSSSWLAAASENEMVRVWDVATGMEQATFTGHTGSVWALAAGLDGSWLASGGDDGTVRVWDVARREPNAVPGHTGPVWALAASPDSSWLASASRDQTVRIWDPTAGVEQAVLTGHTDSVMALAVEPHGDWFASAGDDGTARVWDVATHLQRAVLLGHMGPVCALVTSPDSSWLASASDDHTVRVWDIPAGVERVVLPGHKGSVCALATGPRGGWLASASDDGTARVWSLETGNERIVLSGHRGPVRELATARDGSWLASAGDDGTVRIWNMHDGTERFTLSGHRGPVRALAMALDGSWLASASDDGTIRVWDVAGGLVRVVLAGHAGSVRALAAAPDGSWLASASHDGTVRIWDIAAGAEQAALRADGPLTSCLVLPDQRRLAAGGARGVYLFAIHI